MKNHARFRDFLAAFTDLVERAAGDEAAIFAQGRPLLADLVRHDDWLPDACAQAVPDAYRQYLLYCDPRERFCVVSFVWGPGVRTPVHDHTVWGMVGVLRGAENCHEYDRSRDGAIASRGQHLCRPGDVDLVSPTVGDVHVVENALADAASVSIHVYGADIGAVRRHVFDPATGAARTFISGYSNATLPNFWDRSVEASA